MVSIWSILVTGLTVSVGFVVPHTARQTVFLSMMGGVLGDTLADGCPVPSRMRQIIARGAKSTATARAIVTFPHQHGPAAKMAVHDRARSSARTRELEPRTLPLAPEARALLVAFSDAIEGAQAPGGNLSHITGAASKAAEQAARIAGVLTLWRDLGAAERQPGDMADAITLAQFYLLAVRSHGLMV